MKKLFGFIMLFLIISGCELDYSNKSDENETNFFKTITENIIAPFDLAYSIISVERRITRYYESAGYLCDSDLICTKLEYENDGEIYKTTTNSFDINTMTYSTYSTNMRSDRTNIFEFAISLSSGNSGYQIQHISYIGRGHGISRYSKNLITSETEFFQTDAPTITLSEEYLISQYKLYEYLFSLMLNATMNLTIEEYLLKNPVN